MNQPAAGKKPQPASAKPNAKKTVSDPSVLMRVEGFDGQITLKADRITITRRGLLNILMYGFSAQREILLTAITEVIFKNANMLQPGHIEFVVASRGQSLQTGKISHNAVKFRAKDQSNFLVLKENVFELMKKNTQKAS